MVIMIIISWLSGAGPASSKEFYLFLAAKTISDVAAATRYRPSQQTSSETTDNFVYHKNISLCDIIDKTN